MVFQGLDAGLRFAWIGNKLNQQTTSQAFPCFPQITERRGYTPGHKRTKRKGNKNKPGGQLALLHGYIWVLAGLAFFWKEKSS